MTKEYISHCPIFFHTLKVAWYLCYSSDKLIALNTLHMVGPIWYSFQSESTAAMLKNCLAQGNIMLSVWIVCR